MTELHAEKRKYDIGMQFMTEAAIDAGFTRDLYLALGEQLSKDFIDNPNSLRESSISKLNKAKTLFRLYQLSNFQVYSLFSERHWNLLQGFK